MLLMRSYKFRMYPSVEQQVLINKTIGCTRFIYNCMLAMKKNNISLNRFDLNKEIPKLYQEYPFLKDVDSSSLRCAVQDLTDGFNLYYKNKNAMPRFKKKGIKNSYRTNYITSIYKGNKYSNIEVDLENKCRILNKTFYQVNTYYPSSQICCRCEKRDKKMKDIRIREYECDNCGEKIERDLNASINILMEGIKQITKERMKEF